jgi:ornithine cyclodeaminase/alanine dehydrogenase-like protein (mu-crystallin family)
MNGLPTNTSQLLFLSAGDVRRALPMREAVEVMKTAFAALSAGEAVMPLRSHVELPGSHGRLLLMPCFLPNANALSLKAVTVFDGNPGRGLPRIQALVTLYDGGTGRPLAVMDGAAVTALRTGAASGAATDLLARPDSVSAGILGAGVQARTQLEAVCAVRAIRTARVFDTDRPAAEAYAREMSAALGIEVAAMDNAAEAVRDADIICAATSARSPVFADADLKQGVHVNGAGSYQPDMQEVPAETVLRARVIVDHRESALAEAGDILVPIQQGRYAADRIAAELGEIVSGKKPGRITPDDITFFKSVGVAIQDLAVASRILANARRLGLGTQVHL